MIDIKNLHKTFNAKKRNEVKALDDVSIELPDIGFVAIYGKSGSGKTTLMNMIGGLDTFDSGLVEINSKEYTKTVDDEFRIGNIGYIFQNYCLDNRVNVYENVARGLRTIGVTDEELIFERVMTALQNVDMVRYYKRNIDTLSGGQQQRVAIARTMVKGAKIILADEPTGNLDEYNTRVVMDILKAMSKTALVVIVTHEADIIEKYADKVIEIKDGKIISSEDGKLKSAGFEDKTKVFLGNLNKEKYELNGVNVEVYGDNVEINVRIVKDNGKYYLTTDSKEIRYIDSASEVQFINKTKEEYLEEKNDTKINSLNKLSYIEPVNSGRLFSAKDSAKEGVAALFSKKTKGGRILFVTLIIFVIAVLALLSAFLQGLNRYVNAGQGVNEKSVNINVNSYDNYSAIKDIANKYGNVYSYMYSSNSGLYFTFYPEGFESIFEKNYEQWIYTSFYDKALLKDKKVIAGDKENLAINEIVISDDLAKIIANNVKQAYSIDNISPEFLMRFRISINNIDYRIKGIVEDDKDCMYLDEVIHYSNMYGEIANVELDELYGMHAEDGVILISERDYNSGLTGLNILGKMFRTQPYDGNQWLINRKEIMSLCERKTKDDEYALSAYYEVNNVDGFFKEVMSEYPSLTVMTKDAIIEREKNIVMPELISSGVTTAVLLVLMFLSAYILMYSTIVARIKEIGIYRAIGVSKNNILFKFFMESIVLLALTVLPVYIVVGIPLVVLTAMNILVTLSWWMYIVSLVILSLLFIGISLLPVIIFLRKTPVEILAKYDL